MSLDHSPDVRTLAAAHPERAEWYRCRPWIEDALVYAGGTHTIEDIEEGIGNGNFQFWSGPKCAVVTAITDYPRQRVMNYFLIGGDLKELHDFIEPRVTHWAFYEQNCDRVIGIGRKGFERVFADSGFRHGWTFIVKDRPVQ